MRRLRYSEGAVRDLEEIYDWIAADNPPAARRVVNRVVRTIEGLLDFSTGRPGRVAGTLEKVVPGFPYVVIYASDTEQPGGQDISIIAVRHAARRPFGDRG